jgi:prepilin-type N-terminal cleavage/methylation domain-containing protein
MAGVTMSKKSPIQTKQSRDTAGFTLIELLFALLISGIVLSSAVQTFAHYSERFYKQQATMASAQELRLALDVLCSEVRLAGAGLLTREVAFTKMEADELQFLANLQAAATRVTANAAPGQRALSVDDATAWPKGKLVVLCTVERCVENRLGADGRRHELTLVFPLSGQLPAGSAVFLLNTVRYYLKPDQSGLTRLMRDVDGGASTLLEGVAMFRFEYRTRQGTLTNDPRLATQVRITVKMDAKNLALSRDVALRS